jgi:hypothetical protein
VTIGVNDIQKHFIPDHLMIMDDRRVFMAHRQAIMDNPLFTTSLWWRRAAPLWPTWDTMRFNVRRYRIQRYNTPDEIAEALRGYPLDHLPHKHTTVYTACSLAVALGATWIGVIGLDLVRHHLNKRLKLVNRSFACLTMAMEQLGVTFVNLSRQSLITSIPHE